MNNDYDDIDEFEEEGPRPPSKSQLKRESTELQKLGEELVNLKPEQLARIEMPPELADAVAEARHIRQHGGRKRQLQYIGKLMRQIDPEPIRRGLEAIHATGAEATARLHRIEQWRERLLAEGDEALQQLIDECPALETQRVRQLVRNAQREYKANKPPKSARELFRYLRDTCEE